MKKLTSIFMAIVLVLGIAIPASAAGIGDIIAGPIETEVEKIARVKAEVLSGNITNEQDVIEVALAQYAEKVAYCRANGIEMDPNESLSITQVIESDASVAGTDSVREVAVTGLFMFDDNGVQITADYLTRFGSNSIDILNGNIHAATTMVVYEQPQQFTIETRVYNIYTIFQNTSGYTADSLQHSYELCDDGEGAQTSSVIYNPASNTSYTFRPSTRFIANGGSTSEARYKGRAIIIKNGTAYYNDVLYVLRSHEFVIP